MDISAVSTEMILVMVVSLIGILATVVYYFARYYFRTHDQDNEVVKTKTIDVSRDQASHIPEKQKVPQPAGQAAEKVAAKPTPFEKPKPKALKDALANTKQGLFGRIKQAFTSEMTDDDLEYLEEILYTSDIGPQTVQRLMESVGETLSAQDKKDLEKVRAALKSEMTSIFSELSSTAKMIDQLKESDKPQIIMIVGVNGAGKTTSIGKLAHQFAQNNLKTMIVAGDTFRAAAREQLQVWGERAQVEIFNPGNVQDPSAVAFDACQSAKSKEIDVVIIDTAGRLHTQDNLMEELKKMKRVVQKVIPDAPHEVLIVLDANSGQNALMQAKTFNEALALTGAILTKLDGTAKGGVALGLACELHLPIKMIGVGEGIEDLRNFNSQEFVDSII